MRRARSGQHSSFGEALGIVISHKLLVQFAATRPCRFRASHSILPEPQPGQRAAPAGSTVPVPSSVPEPSSAPLAAIGMALGASVYARSRRLNRGSN